MGALLGPGALALGIMGNRAANRDPEVSGKVHAAVAITLGVLETIFHCGGAAWMVVKLSLA